MTILDAFRDGFFGCSYLQRCLLRGYYPNRYKGMHAWETLAFTLGQKIKQRHGA